MIGMIKTTAAITTALMLGVAAAGPASADSAWPDVGERAGNKWTPGDGEPRPMDRSYFEDRESDPQRAAGHAPDADGTARGPDEDRAEDGFFTTIIDAIQQVGESG